MIKFFVIFLVGLFSVAGYGQSYWYRIYTPPDTLTNTEADTITFDQTFAHSGDLVVGIFVDNLSGTTAGTYYVDYSLDLSGDDWFADGNGSFGGADETIAYLIKRSVDADPIYQRVRVRYEMSGTHSTEIRTKVLFKG